MKKVIFVGGTSYSGSTFFDMILSNDQKGFSCGEVHALFRPYRPHHLDPECGCGDKGCGIWRKILEKGENDLYESIFDLFPGTEFIVDSSKIPFWIDAQTRMLERKGIEVKNILVWKDPLELAHSYDKRGKLKDWPRAWKNYHRLYLSVVSDWRSVRYSSLVSDSRALEGVCSYLGIPFFPGKERYWDKEHHTLFGNTSARVHLCARSGEKFHEAASMLVKTGRSDLDKINTSFRKIYYEKVSDDKLKSIVHKAVKADESFGKLEHILSSMDVSAEKTGCPGNDISGIRLSRFLLGLKSLKYHKLGL